MSGVRVPHRPLFDLATRRTERNLLAKQRFLCSRPGWLASPYRPLRAPAASYSALLFQSQQNIDIDVIPLIPAVVALVIHIAFAVGVFKDLARRKADRQLWFVAPIFYTGGTLGESVFVAAGFFAEIAGNTTNSSQFPANRLQILSLNLP